jgi:hypothetical protein
LRCVAQHGRRGDAGNEKGEAEAPPFDTYG